MKGKLTIRVLIFVENIRARASGHPDHALCSGTSPHMPRSNLTRSLRWPASALLALLVLCTACGSLASTDPLPTPRVTVVPTVARATQTPGLDRVDPDRAEINVWHPFTGTREDLLKRLVADFEASNTYGIQVTVEYHGDLQQEVETALAMGTPPDLIISPCEQVAHYAAHDALVPLTVYLQHPKYGLSDTLRSDLSPVALRNPCLSGKSQDPIGILWDTSAVVMHYNADWLKRLKVNSPPQSLDEFKAICTIARDRKNDAWGTVHVADGTIAANWILSLGGTLVDSRGHLPHLYDPAVLTYLTMIHDQVAEGSAYGVTSSADALPAFAAEKALFTFGTTDALPAYVSAIQNPRTRVPAFNWTIAPLPHLNGDPTVVLQGKVISLMRTTPRQQLASWLFLRWWLEPQHDALWALETGSLLLFHSNQEAPEMQAYLKQNPQYATACGLVGHGTTEPALPHWSSVADLLAQAVDTVSRGGSDPRAVLAAAQAAVDELPAQ